MSQPITITGLITTTPRHLKTAEGLDITSFRLASSERHYDTAKGRWVDGETNWYTITAFHELATNAHKSVNKGDRIIVSGNLRIRDWDSGEQTGTSVEIEAEAIGHDLSWGEAVFNRTILVKAPRGNDRIDNTAELERVKQELKDLRDTLASLAEEN